MRKLVILLALALYSVIAAAQDGKVSLSVSHSGKDSIGKQLAFAVREAIRSSAGYKLVGRDDAGMEVLLVTLDPETSGQASSNWTFVAVTVVMTNFLPYEKGNPQTWYPIYMTSVAMTVGSNRINEQARSILATVDEALEKYRTEVRKQ
jgi:hypothetical protein